jgi:hypothetical protein
MMNNHLKLFLATIVGGALVANIASAGVITSAAVDPLSPGLGTVSVPLILTLTPGNDNSSDPLSGNDILVGTKAFESNEYIDIVFTVASSSSPTGPVTEYHVVETVDNDTGVDWIAHNMYLGFGTGAQFVASPAGDGLDFDTPEMDPLPSSTAFATVVVNQDHLHFSNGVHGSIQENYLFRLDIPNNITSFTLRQIPVAVPEPSVLALGCLAIASLAGIRRSR